MSEQDNGQVSSLQRPTTDNRVAWKTYWEQQGQPWRTEQEISQRRQKDIIDHLEAGYGDAPVVHLIENIRLGRADIEWLIARKGKYLSLIGADLRLANLDNLPLEGASLDEAHLEGAHLGRTRLQGASFVRARLHGAYLIETHLEKARLGEAHLEGAIISKAHLEGSKLDGAFFDTTTFLHNVILGDSAHGFASVVGTHWNGIDLSFIDWTKVKKLGDEIEADRPAADQLSTSGWRSEKKPLSSRLYDYQTAVRANRQLSIALKEQGMNEEGAHFAYRAQRMQRKVFWYQRKFGQYLFSLLIDLLSGYGYEPMRSFIAYLIVIAAFAITYFLIGHAVGPALSPLGSVVFSMTSFHGRGFFPGGIGLDDPLTVVAAFEAFVGLLIEVTFIATLTQRLFGK